MNDRIRILLAEDQEIVRQGLRYIIDSQSDMLVVGEAADWNEAIRLAISAGPEIILMDIRMPGRTGIEATRAILRSQPGIRIILLTTFDIREYVYDGIRAGAVGYLLKDAETQTLLESIRAAYRGAVIYRSASSGKAISEVVGTQRDFTPPGDQEPSLLEPLTDREQEILQQMAYGGAMMKLPLRSPFRSGRLKPTSTASCRSSRWRTAPRRSSSPCAGKSFAERKAFNPSPARASRRRS
jgi:DNA-binding NarL/FixJ family response regulator